MVFRSTYSVLKVLQKKLFFSIFQFLKRVSSEFSQLELIFLTFPWEKSISVIFLWTKFSLVDFSWMKMFFGIFNNETEFNGFPDNIFFFMEFPWWITCFLGFLNTLNWLHCFFSNEFLTGVFLDKIDSHRFLFDKNEIAVFPSQWLQFLRFFVLERVCLEFPWTNLFLTDFLLNKIELYGLPVNSQRFFKDAHTTSKQISSTKTFLRRTNQQNVSMNVSPKKI